MENVIEIVQQQAEDALNLLSAKGVVTAKYVADSVLGQTAYWEKPMPNGEKLLFVRFFSPVVQREEVFLGNILFNAFLSQAFTRAVADGKLGQAELVANDLENYYFLVRTKSDVAQLATAFRAEVERSLPDLFFGEQDEARGIYGSLETMLDFDKANVEPFPVFIMPKSYAERLEASVRESLLCKIERSPLDRNPTSIMANLAFFYSHDGAEMQSPYLFLARLASRYRIVDADDLRQALNLKESTELSDEAAVKKLIEDSLKQRQGRGFSSAHLCKVLKQAVTKLGEKADKEPDKWRMPYIRSKFLARDEETVTNALLDGVSLGYLMVSSPRKAVDVGCRVCGVKPMEAEDKSILMGQNTHKFHNQSGKQKSSEDPKACLRCATCTYLMVKLIGSEAIGQPQVPKTYNLIFHYGKHDDDEVKRLTHQVDLIWNLVQTHQQRERTAADIRKSVEEAKQKWSRNELFKVCPWLAQSTPPSESCPLEVLAVSKLGEAKTERHILGLGMGGYRMILFILPQLKPPRGKKGEPPPDPYLTQRRFSDSRVTVTALLSFLRELCGCDGPFYYQSLPMLTPDAFQGDTFYVRNAPISVRQAQQEYEAVTQLAWKLIWQRGSDGFVRKVVLAEKLLEDPLGTFAAVMRDSAILGQTKGSYKRLPGVYREDWRAQDLTEYAKFIQRLSKLQEVSSMALQVDREQLDEFCSQLFRTLDGLGLLPRQLRAKPNEFEKYTRLLFGSIQRYNDVEAGFKEWESRVLRDAPYRKEEHYLKIEALRQWLVNHHDVFTKKANLQHLHTSLYARVFNYLYPRRVLVNAYCAKHQSNPEAIEPEFVERALPNSIGTEVQQLKETYSDEWETIVADAKASLIANAAYYRKVLRGEEPTVPPEEVEQAEAEALEEVTP